MSLGFLITCIGCGCDDDSACVTVANEPCSWLRVDQEAGLGVCSHCPGDVQRFDQGARELFAEDLAEKDIDQGHFDDDDSRLILPGEDDFDSTLELLD